MGRWFTAALTLAPLWLLGCAMSLPEYHWQRTDADPALLEADQTACLRQANRLPGFLAPGAFLGDPVRRTLFKDCMETRGWQKEPAP